ncbi:phosphate transporter (Pho88) [Umbelopsis sp. WA50703]
MSPPAWLNHPLFNVASFLILGQLAKRLNLDNPDNLFYARATYVFAQATVIGLAYWLMSVVDKKNDTTTLRYVKPAAQEWDGTKGQEELVNTTNKDYDIAEIKKSITQTLTGLGIIGFLHLQFKFTQPLVIQSILVFKTFFLSKEALLHVWGEPAVGDLRRPFKNDSPFGGMMGGQPLTDKASIKRAEKALKNQ